MKDKGQKKCTKRIHQFYLGVFFVDLMNVKIIHKHKLITSYITNFLSLILPNIFIHIVFVFTNTFIEYHINHYQLALITEKTS